MTTITLSQPELTALASIFNKLFPPAPTTVTTAEPLPAQTYFEVTPAAAPPSEDELRTQVRELVLGLVRSAAGRDAVKQLLARYGVERAGEISVGNLPAFINDLWALG